MGEGDAVGEAPAEREGEGVREGEGEGVGEGEASQSLQHTRRITLLMASAIKSARPPGSAATPFGELNAARLPGPSMREGVLAALAGLIFAARLNTATPKAGLGFELDVIAACFIGGASASGGVGKVLGAVIGAFIMGVMNNGMSIMGIGIDYQQVIKGLVLLAAVCVDVYNKKK